MASADEIYITIRGKGGHAAAPHQTVDTILVASHLVVALQQIPHRRLFEHAEAARFAAMSRSHPRSMARHLGYCSN